LRVKADVSLSGWGILGILTYDVCTTCWVTWTVCRVIQHIIIHQLCLCSLVGHHYTSNVILMSIHDFINVWIWNLWLFLIHFFQSSLKHLVVNISLCWLSLAKNIFIHSWISLDHQKLLKSSRYLIILFFPPRNFFLHTFNSVHILNYSVLWNNSILLRIINGHNSL